MTMLEDEALARARRRVARVGGFYAHVLVYLVVNALLATIDLTAGTRANAVFHLDWAYWSILFWGVIVVTDAVRTFLLPALLGERWQQRTLDHYLQHH
jgi:hypothetical protein